MSYFLAFSDKPAGIRLPYQQATITQRVLAVAHLRQRLAHHFPTLRPNIWVKALADFQPDLWLVSLEVVLAQADVEQLVQHLAASPELPVLDPPIYGLPALQLAQHSLQTSELVAGVLPELVAAAVCGPRLYALLHRLAQPSPLAEQVVQAWCWNLSSAPPLTPGPPNWAPAPGSVEVEVGLEHLGQLDGFPPASPNSLSSTSATTDKVVATDLSISPTPAPVSTPSPTPRRGRNQTFSIQASLADQLKQVSYWDRKPMGWLVNQALNQFLRQHPESFIPLPKK